MKNYIICFKVSIVFHIVILISQLFTSCSTTEQDHRMVKCNIAGYNIALGEDLEKIKKEWQLGEIKNVYKTETTQLFSITYEEHDFQYWFYKSKLVKAKICIPRQELNGNIIKIEGKSIPFDKTFRTKSRLNESNYIIECDPFEWDGMKEIRITVEFTDVETLLK